jgi:hypothetical protein
MLWGPAGFLWERFCRTGSNEDSVKGLPISKATTSDHAVKPAVFDTVLSPLPKTGESPSRRCFFLEERLRAKAWLY